MRIVIVNCETGLLVGRGGRRYTENLSDAMHFQTTDEARAYCSEHSYTTHKIIEVAKSEKHGRFIDYC